TGEPFVKPLRAAMLPFWKTTAVVACADPYHAMAVLTGKFADRIFFVAHLLAVRGGAPEIHPTAVVPGSGEIGEGASVGPHCVVEAGARIGVGSRLYPSCYVGRSAQIGADCILFPNVIIYEWTVIGDRVRIHGGVVIGADGFGYAPKLEAGK